MRRHRVPLPLLQLLELPLKFLALLLRRLLVGLADQLVRPTQPLDLLLAGHLLRLDGGGILLR